MIERDRGDRRHRGRDDVGRIQPPAEPDFQDRDVHLRAPKQLECHRRRHFEERRLHVERAVTSQRVDDVTNVGDGLRQRGGPDRPAVDDESFVEIDQMRRRVPRRSMARGAQRRVHHGRHRSFPVGAGDVDRAIRAIRAAEPLDDRGDVVETELDSELFETEQISERIHAGNC